MSYLEQQNNFLETLGKLPSAVFASLSEFGPSSEMYLIGDDFALALSETGKLFETTDKLISGEVKPEEFVEKIRTDLDEERKEKAADVARAINEKILKPIREAFKKATEGGVPLPPNPNGINNPPPELSIPAPVPPVPAPANPADQENAPAQSREEVMALIGEEEPALAATNPQSAPAPAFYSTKPPTPQPAPFVPPVSKVDTSITFESARPQETENTDSASPETAAPENLPTAEPDVTAEAPKEAPIWHTMQKDMAKRSAAQPQAASADDSAPAAQNRGKFGTGFAPTVSSPSPKMETQTPQPPKESFMPKREVQEASQVNVKPNFLSPSNPITVVKPAPKQPNIPPPPPPPRPVPIMRPAAPKAASAPTPVAAGSPNVPPGEGEDIIGDKLTKIVRIPSERKQYVVDPYREPID